MAEREISVDPNFLCVPDAACQGAGCKAFWGYGNELYVCAGGRKSTRDEPSGIIVTGDEPAVHHIKWDTDMHAPHSRKLVNEACSVFVKLQQQMQLTHTGNNLRNLILKYSREYRSVVKACIMDLHHALKIDDTDTMQQLYSDQLVVLEMTELLWSLCEILLIDIIPGGSVLRQLIDWWQLRFVDYDRKARLVMKSPVPEQHESYWETVLYFTLQGRIDDVCHLLSLHSKSSDPLYRVIYDLLKSMPSYSRFTGQSVAEFDMRWHKWHDSCRQCLDDNTFITDENLLTICRILAGDDSVFTDLQDLLGTWYCFLISRLLYSNPTIHATDLQYHAHACIDAFGGLSKITHWDAILLAAIELDIHQVIRQCSSEFRNWWLVAHLTDLLHHLGTLEPHIHNFGASLREFLILEYASSLMSHHSLWQVGITYFEHCLVYGRQFMAEFIEHLSIETEKKALKVLHICEKNELIDQSKSICKTMGVRALHNDRLGSALYWGLKSKDATFVAYVAERYLTEYSRNGHFTDLDLIDNLGSSMLLTTRLTFLGKYREYHKLYANKEYTEAATLLLSLLTARVAPKRFWSMLLLDAVPLLEADKVIFNSQQTFELLHCLEELHMSQKSNLSVDFTKDQPEDDIENDKSALLRLALARNLSRAIVHEGLSIVHSTRDSIQQSLL
jgi:nuclear pore complex protein Nup85